MMKKVTAVILAGAMALNGAPPAYALAPASRFRPIYRLETRPGGSYEIIEESDEARSWGREAVQSVRDNRTLGSSFRNRVAFRDISILIGKYLKLGISPHTLIPEIKKHIGAAELAASWTDEDRLLAGFAIDELTYSRQENAYHLPLYRNGIKRFLYKYYLTDDGASDMTIPLGDGGRVMVRLVEASDKVEVKAEGERGATGKVEVEEKRKDEEIRKYAEALFDTKSADAAKLAIKTEDSRLKGLTGDWGNAFRGTASPESMWRILTSPSKSKDEILARQRMLGAMMALPEERFSGLNEAVFDTFSLLDNISKVAMAFSMIDVRELLMETGLDMAAFEARKKRVTEKETWGFKHVFEAAESVFRHAPQIEKKIGALEGLIANIGSIDDPLAKAVADELKKRLGDFKPLSAEDMLRMAKDGRDGEIGRLSDTIRANITPLIMNAGCLIAFASLAKKDKYAKASFDTGRPASFEDGWSFLWKKEGQRQNPSGKDTRIKILTGSNNSGKSYFLAQCLFMQLLGQSFGYIPAKSGNLRIYDNITYMDRINAIHDMNLSLFGNEAADWKGPAESVGDDTLLFADEPFSTTSPADRARLLKGVANYCRKRRARLIATSHDEDFVEGQTGKPDVSVYHFRVKLNKEKKGKLAIEFIYELAEGPDDSNALAVAEALGLQQGIIDRARAYLDGEALPAKPPRQKSIAPVNAYSDAEREGLKKERGDFLPFFPYRNSLVERDEVSSLREGVRRLLRWRYAKRDDEGYTERGAEKLKFDPVFANFSAGNDFHENAMMKVDYGQMTGRRGVLEAVASLLKWGPSRDPADILERQRMFGAIIKDESAFGEKRWKAWELAHDVYNYLGALTLDLDRPFEYFNLYFLNEMYHNIRQVRSGPETELFLALVDVNLKFSGLTPETAGIKDDIGKARALMALEGEWRAQEKAELDRSAWVDEVKRKAVEFRAKLKKIMGGLVSGEDYGFEDCLWIVLSRLYSKLIEMPLETRDSPVDAAVRQMCMEEHKRLGKLKGISALEEANWPMIREAFRTLKPHIDAVRRQPYSILWPDPYKFMDRLEMLVSGRDPVSELTAYLRGYDSVHLHQIANYYEFILKPVVRGLSSGCDFLKDIKSKKSGLAALESHRQEWNAAFREKDYRKAIELAKGFLIERKGRLETMKAKYEQKVGQKEGWEGYLSTQLKNIKTELAKIELLLNTPDEWERVKSDRLRLGLLTQVIDGYLVKEYKEHLDRQAAEIIHGGPDRYFEEEQVFTELDKMRHIFAMAYIIKYQGWSPVKLHDRPELEIKKPWSLDKSKSSCVRNDVRFNAAEMVRLLAGSNMSGKSFDLRTIVWNLLAAHATGFGPNEGMTMPALHKIAYLDRIKRELDVNLGGWGTEVEYLKAFFKAMDTDELSFAAVDEAGSSTSSRYQSGIVYALGEETLERGQMLALASHNHDAVQALHDNNRDRVKIRHFRTHRDDAGRIIFDYEIEEGDAPSNGVEIAGQQGLGMITSMIDAYDIFGRISDPLIAAFNAGEYEKAVKTAYMIKGLRIARRAFKDGGKPGFHEDMANHLLRETLPPLDGSGIPTEGLERFLKSDDADFITEDLAALADIIIKKALPHIKEYSESSHGGGIEIVDGHNPCLIRYDYSTDAHDENSQHTANDIYTGTEEFASKISDLLLELKPEARSRLAEGRVLLAGPGRSVKEALAILKALPECRELVMIDNHMPNLIEVKREIDKRPDIDKGRIKLRHSDLHYMEGEFDLVIANRVIDTTIIRAFSHGPNKHSVAQQWAYEVKRLLNPDGAFLTRLSDRDAFTENGFTVRHYENMSGNDFIAAKNPGIFRPVAEMGLPEAGKLAPPVTAAGLISYIRNRAQTAKPGWQVHGGRYWYRQPTWWDVWHYEIQITFLGAERELRKRLWDDIVMSGDREAQFREDKVMAPRKELRNAAKDRIFMLEKAALKEIERAAVRAKKIAETITDELSDEEKFIKAKEIADQLERVIETVNETAREAEAALSQASKAAILTDDEISSSVKKAHEALSEIVNPLSGWSGARDTDLTASSTLAKEILRLPVKKVVVVGMGLSCLPLILALAGKEALFIDRDAANTALMNGYAAALREKTDADIRFEAITADFTDGADLRKAEGADAVIMADLATLYPDGRPAEWFRQARRCFTGRRNGYLIIDENDRSRLGVYNAFAKEFPKRTSLYSSAHPHFYAMANREFSRNTLYRVYFEEERIVPAVDVLRSRADAERLSDTIKLAGARSEKSPVIVALGTDWIKGYEKDRYLQYDALNPLVISIRRFCEANGMTFIDRKDDELPAEIEKARQGEKNAKVIVLAGEETVKSGGFGGLRDDENALLIGVDNSGLTVDSYIRLIEMLDISFKLAFGRGSEVNMDNPHIRVKKDPRFRNLYIMLPKAEPMNYESLRELYRVQIFA